MAQPPFADSDNHYFAGEGFTGTATLGQTTNIDYKITTERYINGAILILDGNQHKLDTLDVKAIDKDNVLGYGANTVLQTFVKNWNITTEKNTQEPIILPYTARIPANVYLRIVYVSNGLINVYCKMNLLLHQWIKP